MILRRSAAARDLSLNVLLTLPALLGYEAGLAVFGRSVANGADLFLAELFRLVGPGGVLVLNAALTAGAVVCVLDAWRRYADLGRRFLGVLFESCVYAVALGPLVLLLAGEGLALPAREPLLAAPWQAVAVALGAGVYEELFFRFLLLSALLVVGRDLLGLRPGTAFAAALALAAAFFALAHHDVVLPGGEPLTFRPLLFRTLAGLFLGLVYWYRGLAAAVYTHAFYDLLVFLG